MEQPAYTTVPHSYFTALLLTVLAMLCWGSWAAVVKIVGNGRFKLFYFGYTFGILLASVVGLALVVAAIVTDAIAYRVHVATIAASAPTELQVGPAVRYALGQGSTMAGASWGVFIWKEFAGGGKRINRLIFLMFVLFLSGLGLLSVAPLYSVR